MPKIIENVRERAVAEARRALTAEGYSAMTVRGVARELGIAPATIYNYFPSKETLAACVMLEDWQKRTGEFQAAERLPARETVRALFAMVRSFAEEYVRSWTQYEPGDRSAAMRRHYHPVLVEQLSGYIRRALPPERAAAEPWLAPFLAELVLRFGSDGESGYEEIEPAVAKLLR